MNFETIGKISQTLESKCVTSEKLTEVIIKEIETKNAAIGGYSDVLFDTSRLEAKASDMRTRTGTRLSPVDGLPVAIKDLIDTYPARCKAGLSHLSNYRPKNDAAVVSKLRAAGAVLIGVTETDPGAFSTDTAQVINPTAPDRIVGGSSGGSAAVVAAGMAFAAIGTDTGGSIRIPANCCSVYGFKPTWGRVDASDVRPLAPSLDHMGPLARCVEDLMIIQNIIDPNFDQLPIDYSLQTSSVKIGIAHQYSNDAAELIKSLLSASLNKLEQHRVKLFEVDLPSPDDILPFHMINLPKAAADYHLRHFEHEWRDYPAIARETIEIGMDVSEEQLAKAETLRKEARKAVDHALENVDAILVPCMPVDAPMRTQSDFVLNGVVHSRLATTIRYTSLFNQTGHPVVSMPSAMLKDGRAASIQLLGKKDDDRNLLHIAKMLERIFDLDLNYADLILSNSEAVFKKRKTLEPI